MLIATDYTILRGVKADCTIRIPMTREPKKVATLIDETAFLERGALEHNKTVFLEDRYHDWRWLDGIFVYYTRIAVVADVVIAFDVQQESANTVAMGRPKADAAKTKVRAESGEDAPETGMDLS
jgi:hypothetical protein